MKKIFSTILLAIFCLSASPAENPTGKLQFVYKLHGQTRRFQYEFQPESDGGVTLHWGIERNLKWWEGTYRMTPQAVEQGTTLSYLMPEDGNHVTLPDNETFGMISREALRNLIISGDLHYDGTVYRLIDTESSTPFGRLLHVADTRESGQMWILDNNLLPIIWEMRNNPLEINWTVRIPENRHPKQAGLTSTLSEIGPGYSKTSVNAAIFRASSVTSRDGHQFVSYYDPEGYLTIASRDLNSKDEDTWKITRTQYKGNVKDAHNVISMGIDGDGYLHLSFDHHGQPLKYCRSVTPYSAELGQLTPMTGDKEEDVTYPEFYPLPDGDMLFVYRSGYSGRGNMVMNRYSRATGKWERVHDVLIDGEGKRNAYWQLHMDHEGTLHLSWVWRETWMVETNHDLCYARSKDGGRTWERSDGTPYTLPITEESAEIAVAIPQKSELINQTSMTADPSGRPLIATYWRDLNDSIPQFRLVSLTESGWKAEKVGNRLMPFSLSGGGTKMIPISRPRVASDGKTIFYLFRDQERGSRVSLATRATDSAEWEITDLTDFPVDAWEPTIDNELWRKENRLHIFVQPVSQGDGEKAVDTPPTKVYVLEVRV